MNLLLHIGLVRYQPPLSVPPRRRPGFGVMLGLALLLLSLGGTATSRPALGGPASTPLATAAPGLGTPAAPLTVALATDAPGNRVPTGTGFGLIVTANGGTPPYRFAIDRFVPTGPLPGPSFTFVVAGVDQNGDSLLCPGERTFRSTVTDATEAEASSDPLTVAVISRVDLSIELGDRAPDLNDPLLKLFRANVFGARAPYTLTWDFDDRSEPVARDARIRRDNGIIHRFPAPGAYHVRVTLSDACSPPQTAATTELFQIGTFP